MIAIGKKHNCIVIVNSSDSTDHYKKYLNKGADYVLLGEGEISLKELVLKLGNNALFPSLSTNSFNEISPSPNRT